ncbi:MAG: hypothetical protein IT371_21690 [Deltaproteobacteria bacterium]|nr:hypothetical protein [Deltaproteobacteria bacterium]
MEPEELDELMVAALEAHPGWQSELDLEEAGFLPGSQIYPTLSRLLVAGVVEEGRNEDDEPVYRLSGT